MSVASDVVRQLQSTGTVSSEIRVTDDVLSVNGAGTLKIPVGDGPTSWRRTVNSSILPRSISAESRRHLLYAILQDLVRPELLLHKDGTQSPLLTPLSADYQPFEDVYRVPAQGRSERTVVYPVHVAVPLVFDTYRRGAARHQTDKGFRGPFLDFFSCDYTGQSRDDGLLLIIQDLFARTSGLSPLDLALVTSLAQSIETERANELLLLTGRQVLPRANDDGEMVTAQWKRLYSEISSEPTYRPLKPFAEQGTRLRIDIQAIACAAGLSRIQRIALVERLLSFHFATYLVRLPRVLYKELDEMSLFLRGGGTAKTVWRERDIAIRYHSKSARPQQTWGHEYQQTMDRLNEAYLLLPVLNNIELAIRTVAATSGSSVIRNDKLAWGDAKELLGRLRPEGKKLIREVLAVLAAIGAAYAGVAPEEMPDLAGNPIEALFEAVRFYYSDPAQRRYPKNHHQSVFESVADQGASSFVQRRPMKYFSLGDEFIFLLVLALFESRRPEDQQTSTAVPRSRGSLLRRRLPLQELEQRLQADLLQPADDAASDDLRSSLARLGLLDRLSDVGEANFLRHPTGI